MPSDVPQSTVWISRLVFFGGLDVGIALLVVAALSDDPPVALWVVGGLLTAFFGYHVASAVVFRVRNPTPEARAAAREVIMARRDALLVESDQGRAGRGTLAHKATKYKAAVLHTGTPGTAVRKDAGGKA